MKNRQDARKFNKKELKDYVNKNGFYSAAILESEINAPVQFKDQIPEGAIYFKAIASNGELNRNGYIIREKAWKPAIDGYLQEGGTILLQHDMDQPIGKALTAKVTKDGLMIEGYVFDDLTGNRFSKGLFGAVSTGHITNEREFENTETGEVLNEEEFRALEWSEQYSDKWVMAVTALDWLENSIVSIGANRKALVTTKDVIKNYIEAYKNDVEEEKEKETEPAEKKEDEPVIEKEVEKIPESAPEEKAEKEENNDNQQNDDEKGKVVIPPAEGEPAENAEIPKESNTVEISKEEAKQIQDAISTLTQAVTSKNKLLADRDAKIKELQDKLNNIPMRKGVVVVNTAQKKDDPRTSFLGQLFKENGIQIKS